MLKRFLLTAVLLLCFFSAGAEESFAPDAFTFAGGTGRVSISCPVVYWDGEKAEAEIVFDSPRYIYIDLDGTRYETVCDEHTSRARIPVSLDRAFEISAATTAMSVPHEITYTLQIHVDALAQEELAGLKWQSQVPLYYAEGFSVDHYEGGYTLIQIRDEGRFLIVPEGLEAPEGLDTAVRVLRQPLDHIYLAATSAMSLFDALDSLDRILFSSLREQDWSVPAARAAMEQGRILFAGKYDAPDYERLVREGCGLAVESTMISHAPKIRELLELLGIPVLVDRSSYEAHPLGRTEWIRLYGALLGKEEEAERFFAQQLASLKAYAPSGKTAAFFYVSSNGAVVVRGPEDYIAKMIELAGGEYALKDMPVMGENTASVSVSMEDFYAMAGDADHLIYNASIDDSVDSLQALLGKNELFSEFRAVREGHVWRADQNLYQAADRTAEFIQDIHAMLTGAEECGFLRLLK